MKKTLLKDLEFISVLLEMDKKNNIETITNLYLYIDFFLELGDFLRIDSIIEIIMLKDFSTRFLIAILTITHKRKKEILNTDKLISFVRIQLEKNNLTNSQINSILFGF